DDPPGVALVDAVSRRSLGTAREEVALAGVDVDRVEPEPRGRGVGDVQRPIAGDEAERLGLPRPAEARELAPVLAPLAVKAVLLHVDVAAGGDARLAGLVGHDVGPAPPARRLRHQVLHAGVDVELVEVDLAIVRTVAPP